MAVTQDDFYNYLNEEMIDNTYNRLMMQSAKRRRTNLVDSDDKTFDGDSPLFGPKNGAPISEISLHVTPTNRKGK